MSKLIRSGDVNLHEVTETKGEILKHNGSWVLAKGEATGSVHTLTVENPNDLIVQQDEFGDMYFTLKSKAKISHTSDHTTVIAPAKIYRQVSEREVDHFADSIVRKVVD